MVVANRRLKLTNLDKVLYPKAKTTKAEVIDYYARVADLILPHLKGRPLTLRRFPEGVGKPQTSFLEKEVWGLPTPSGSDGGARAALEVGQDQVANSTCVVVDHLHLGGLRLRVEDLVKS